MGLFKIVFTYKGHTIALKTIIFKNFIKLKGQALPKYSMRMILIRNNYGNITMLFWNFHQPNLHFSGNFFDDLSKLLNYFFFFLLMPASDKAIAIPCFVSLTILPPLPE
jgi:hypothetical protein